MTIQKDAEQCSLVAGQQHIILKKANRGNTEATAAAISPVLLLTQGFRSHSQCIQVKDREAKGASRNVIWT